jgi:hypothetical protein
MQCPYDIDKFKTFLKLAKKGQVRLVHGDAQNLERERAAGHDCYLVIMDSLHEGNPIAANTRQWWIIDVDGYGEFSFFGNEEEAEERRAAKAEWEGGVGCKRPADRSAAEDRKKIAASLKQFRWRLKNDVELLRNERDAIRQA